MKILKIMLVFIPISLICKFMGVAEPVIFVLSALAIIPLAGVMGEATDVVSYYAGNRVGGFLNATFGNATELIIGICSIKAGLFDIVKASLAGSVIGNILLVLGLSMLCGGIKYKTQVFNKKAIDVTSSMLLFAVIGLTIPAIFTHTVPAKLLTTRYEGLSILVAVIMILIYVLSMLFSFYTHKDIYVTDDEETDKPEGTLKRAIIELILATVFIAIESEIFVGSVEPMTSAMGLSEFFVGIIIVPVIGNAAEHSTAIIMAVKNKMNVSIEIALGSSLQIILFVTPVLIFISLLFKPMSMVFNPFELVALFISVMIANRVASDGQSNWLEGVQLVAVYVIIAAAFFIL